MGFLSFGSKKKIYVSSTVYNLAGDENERPNYLKTTIVGKVVADTDTSVSISESIQNAYITGPGIRLRSFMKWANTSGYNDLLGMQPATIYLGDSVDQTVLAEQIPHPAGQSVNILNTEVGNSDFTWWADQYMYANYNDQFNTNWTVDFADDTNTVHITLADGTEISFIPPDYVDNSNYLYATYSTSADGKTEGDVVTGDVIPLGSSEAFPSVDGWTTDGTSVVPTDVTLTKTVTVVKSYSDGRPDETETTETTSTESYSAVANVYERTDYAGMTTVDGVQSLHNTRQIMYQNQTGSAVAGEPVEEVTTEDVDGVTVTTTMTTTEETLVVNRSYRIDTQDIVTSSFTGAQVFIYRYGSGNSVLDAMFSPTESTGMFAPFIPVRIDNRSITNSRFDDYYDMCAKAYKKATNAKFTKLIDKVEDNENLGDIDYAYAVFGVSLNVKENACKKYIYKWFQTMLETSTGVTTAYGTYKTQMALAMASVDTWNTWLAAQDDPTNPLYGTTEPTKIPYPTLPTSSVNIKGNRLMNYNITVSWSAMAETIGTGMHDATHKVGDCWFVLNADDDYSQVIYTGNNDAPENAFSVSHITLYWQETATRWRAMSVWGLNHTNKIYGGKSVDTSAKSALNDDEESGFIIPLQRDIYASISLVDATQMSTACMFMVFNCYKVVKQKWYQTGIFKIVLIVVIIVVSYYTGGAGAGLLGSAATVGAAVGLTGIAALIVGAVANALAAMILTKLIGYASTKVFGDKIGAIVGAIASVVAVSIGTGMANGATMAESFNGLMSAPNLIQLSNAAGNGYAQYMQAAVKDTIAETQKVLEDYSERSKEISEQYADVIGTGNGIIDPTQIMNSTQAMFENMDSFLSRTLLTGSDISDMTVSMLTSFADVTLSTELS